MTPLLQILALMRDGRWDEAHNLVQRDDSSSAAWLHAMLHVQEGDLENAEYWYGKSGRNFRSRGALGEELDELETSLRGTNGNRITDSSTAKETLMNEILYDIPLTRIDGSTSTLRDYQGYVLLIVNVASKCGLTPQYEALEKLHEAYRDRKFAVLGFPANDFAGQEPGSDAEIASFCTSTFGVQFPMYSKMVVTGANRHALYDALTAARPETEDRAGMESMLRGHGIEPTAVPEVVWNFEKFLVSRDGRVVRRFSPDTAPDATKLIAAIDAEIERS